MKELYLKYARAVIQEQNLYAPPALDHDTAKLLEIIFVAHHDDRPLTVTDAMKLRIIASPASIHRKLDQLRELGYVDGLHRERNRRTRYLTPLAKAHAHFENLGLKLQSLLHEDSAKEASKTSAYQMDNIDEFRC